LLLIAALAAVLPYAARASTPAFTDVDVGTPTLAGSLKTTTGTNGKVINTIIGGGADMWGAADAFNYAYFKVTGDFDYVVRVQDLQGPDNWTKAGIDVRVDTGSGTPDPSAPHILNMATRIGNGTTGGQYQIGVQYRSDSAGNNSAGNSDWTSPTGTPRPAYPDTWLRVERVGSVIYEYYSYDGKTWTQYQPFVFDTAGSYPAGTDNGTYFTNAWPSTIFLGLAVTAHNDSDTYGGKAIFTDFGPHAGVPIAINTQPQASVSVQANSPLTLSVGAAGDPVHYQWMKDGAPIKGAVGPTYSVALPQAGDAGTYTVKLSGGGTSLTSGNAVVKIVADTTPPTIGKVAYSSPTKLAVSFSEPVSDTALTAANYTLDNGVTVSSVTRTDPAGVTLTTSKMADGTAFNLSVSNVQDTAGNPIAAASKLKFTSNAFVLGSVLHKFWSGISANSVAALTNDVRYPNNPTVQTVEPMFEYPPNGGNEAGDNYGNALIGWFIPPKTGSYVFFTCSDDYSSLFLSTDDNPANVKLIAEESGWSGVRSWVSVGSGDPTTKRSDSCPDITWPGGNTINLTAGNRYYIMDLHSEGGGGDNVEATYIMSGEADPVDGDAPKLVGNVIGTYVDTSGTVNITQQPTAAQALVGQTATLSVAATGTSIYGSTPVVGAPPVAGGGGVTYQWQKNGQDIPGATLASYTTPVLALADSGAKYKVNVSIPGTTVASSEVGVTVSPDTTPPTFAVGVIKNASGTFDVGVEYNKPTDSSAGVQANYSISGGTITSFKYYPNSPGAVLTVSGLTEGSTYTVTVKNVSDTFGNKITSASESFTMGTLNWGNVGEDQLKLGNGVIPVGANGFDIYSDSISEWNNYDESTFTYEAITGDFDKKVQVIYQDTSSEWARAGIVVRDVLNFGVSAVDQTGDPTGAVNNGTTPPFTGKAGRYQKCHVNPVHCLPPSDGGTTNGNNAWEGNRRLITGGGCTSALGQNGGSPPYPNAWCRIQRVGQTLAIYRSIDGVNWLQMGSTSFPDLADPDQKPLPDTVYVGPEYAPENGNIYTVTPGTPPQGMWLAKFRNYGDTFSSTPTLTWTYTSSGLTLTYTGTLQSATSVNGPWTAVTGTSPQTVPTTGKAAFFRASQ
jgi:hypothetical protein